MLVKADLIKGGMFAIIPNTAHTLPFSLLLKGAPSMNKTNAIEFNANSNELYKFELQISVTDFEFNTVL